MCEKLLLERDINNISCRGTANEGVMGDWTQTKGRSRHKLNYFHATEDTARKLRKEAFLKRNLIIESIRLWKAWEFEVSQRIQPEIKMERAKIQFCLCRSFKALQGTLLELYGIRQCSIPSCVYKQLKFSRPSVSIWSRAMITIYGIVESTRKVH